MTLYGRNEDLNSGRPPIGPGWDCEAYGPDGREFGAWCFIADQFVRTCASQPECHAVTAGARQQMFQRIQALAASGDPVWVLVAKDFTSPDQIFGGGDDGQDES